MSDSRRAFLQKFGAIAASVTIIPIAAGCGGDKAASTGGATQQTASMDCNDVSSLTDQDKSLRQTLSYVTESPEEGKYCHNCQFYTVPATEGACGGCTILKGPIAAEGYCTSWAAKPA